MLEDIKGLGPKTIIELNKLNITNVEDIINHYPYKYNHYKPQKLSKIISDEEVVINGTIQSLPKISYIKRNLNRLTFSLNTSEEIINVVIFNRGFLKTHLNRNKEITVIGKYNKLKNTFTANDIKLKMIKETTIEPVYKLGGKIKNTIFNKILQNILFTSIKTTKYIPDYLVNKYGFINKEIALKEIHNPTSLENMKKAKLYLTYEELFIYMLKLNYLKIKRKTSDENNYKNFALEDINNFIKTLPFQLTKDQNSSLKSILDDLSSPKRMNRLLLGDVGSGKTIVAFLALYANFLAKNQGVIMIPTEILANQHYNNAKKIFANTKIKVEILTSSIKPSKRKEIIESLINKKIDILIGTHSVLNDEVIFNNLGLVITDEQHRFGVKQRQNLQQKGKEVDILYMSATPIPRTLALTLYGDMDISQIKTKPNNNNEIKTKLLKEKDIKIVLNEMVEEIKQDHQIYVIVPLVEENEELDLEDVTSIYNKLNTAFNKKIPMDIIHGKLKNEEKATIMQNFIDNKIKILISTTVIEVGIDVKNATMIVIFNAERFGLATLHQLRGRVGRSSLESKCYVISNYEKERLKVLEESNDGFYISEKDFELRGTGDIFGVKQSGDMNFKIVNLKNDYKILLQAQKDSEEFLQKNLININMFPSQKKLLKSIEFID